MPDNVNDLTETITTLVPKRVESKIPDETRRMFLKFLFSTGIGAFFLIFSQKRAEALTFGQSGYIAPSYLTKFDEASATITYVGQTEIGTATSAAAWSIKRLSVNGNVTSIEWADGTSSFNQIWDNRASLSYS